MEKDKDKYSGIGKIDLFQRVLDFSEASFEIFQEQQEAGVSFSLGGNSRCVPVGTKPITPGGCNRKELSKVKRQTVKFRCSVYEKKLLQVKANRSRLSISEFCHRAAFQLEIKERLSNEHIEVYKTLVKFHNNFKSIGNMFRKKDPKLAYSVYQVAKEIKEHLKKLEK